MKHMKKIASFLLAAIMVLAVATTVFAADKPTITAPAGSTHTYKVYQIFTGIFQIGSFQRKMGQEWNWNKR